MRMILGIFLLFFTPAYADVCSSSNVISGSMAIVGATCTAIPPQKSDIYNATSGFTYTVPNGVTIEVINAGSLLGLGTIILPASPTDGMPLTLEAPHGITLVTISANTGQTISGSTTSIMTAGVPYRLKYSGVNSTWYPN